VIYFVKFPGSETIKIGYTGWLPDRLQQLTYQYDLEGDVEVLGVLDGNRRKEKEMHERFADLRIGRSEFFRPGQELLDFIRCYAMNWHRYINAFIYGDKRRITFLYSYKEFEQLERFAVHEGCNLGKLIDLALCAYAQARNYADLHLEEGLSEEDERDEDETPTEAIPTEEEKEEIPAKAPRLLLREAAWG
jgi:hypothetical protein